MRFPQFALLLVAILVAPAAAQQPANPVTSHYRAYRAALERGDLATADTEATAALETAQLDPHSTGTVAALAMNVALVRLSEGHRAQALSPAQLAASLAGNTSSHVDPLAVDIAVKRAALQVGDQSEEQLLAALNAAHEHGGLDEYVYDGAADLGAWAVTQNHLPVALEAWRLAVATSSGSTDADILSKAHALIEVGITMFYIDVAQAPPSLPHQSQPLPLASGSDAGGYHPNVGILTPLAEAARITRPLAMRASSDGRMTDAQLQFSRASAFYSAELSLLSLMNVDPGEATETSFSRYLMLPAHAGQTACFPRVIPQPMPRFPPHERNQSQVGAVMTRLVIDDSGRVTNAQVVATVGGDAFARSVNAVVSRWRVERGSSSVGGCEMGMVLFAPVTFRFAD